MAEEQHSEGVQRWTAKRRAALVLSLLKGETTAADGAPRLKIAEVEGGGSGFYAALRTHCARGARRKTRCASEKVNRLKRKVTS